MQYAVPVLFCSLAFFIDYNAICCACPFLFSCFLYRLRFRFKGINLVDSLPATFQAKCRLEPLVADSNSFAKRLEANADAFAAKAFFVFYPKNPLPPAEQLK
jgi:hypothetical protein